MGLYLLVKEEKHLEASRHFPTDGSVQKARSEGFWSC